MIVRGNPIDFRRLETVKLWILPLNSSLEIGTSLTRENGGGMIKFNGMKSGAFLLSLVISLLAVSHISYGSVSSDLDRYLSACHQNGQFNGTVLIARNGRVVYHNSFGIVDINTQKPLDPTHGFRLASISKTFTALAVMICEQEGTLAYNDDIRKFLPTLPYEGITIQRLLHHTSGLPDYGPLMESARRTDTALRENLFATNEDMLAVFIKRHPPLLFPPGSQFQYCNTGYALLALIVEKSSGKSFGNFLQTRIFQPLNMKQTFLFNPLTDQKRKKRVIGFATTPEGQRLPHDQHFLNGIFGDGGIYATASDLFLWDQAFYQGQLVGKNAIDEALTSGKCNDGHLCGYGYGWRIEQTGDGGKKVSHQGQWVGFRSSMERWVDDSVLIIVLTSGTNVRFSEIKQTIQSIFHGKPYEIPRPSASLVFSQSIRNNGLTAAVEQIRKRWAEHPRILDFNTVNFEQLGLFYAQKNELDKAVRTCKLNVEFHSATYSAYNALGKVYLYQKKPMEAITSFKKSLTLYSGEKNDAHIMLERMRQKAPPEKQHLFK